MSKGGVLWLRTFCGKDVLYLGRFLEGSFVERRFAGRTFCSEGCYVAVLFVLAQRKHVHEQEHVDVLILYMYCT